MKINDVLKVDRVLRPGGVVGVSVADFYPTIINHPKSEELTAIVEKVCISWRVVICDLLYTNFPYESCQFQTKACIATWSYQTRMRLIRLK